MRNNPLRNKIQKPYTWKIIDRAIINEFPFANHKDWTTNNYRYDPIKKRIKNHYSLEQNDHCIYCRQAINFKGYDEPIEHIIPKEARYDLMFIPFNLALSCRVCNTKKSTHSPLLKRYRNNSALDYAIYDSSYFRILHPHFDNFHNYIYIEDGLFYRSINKDKGYLHINFFDLNSALKVIDLARSIKINNASLYKALTHKLRDNTISNNQKRKIKNIMNDIIDRRPLL